jgi:hypothetical protein
MVSGGLAWGARSTLSSNHFCFGFETEGPNQWLISGSGQISTGMEFGN